MKSNRRQRNRELTIQTILDTARILMREEGVAALSMQELARRMDMRAPSLYNYFSGKMEIYDALFKLGFVLLGKQFNEALKDAKGAHDEFRLIIEGYMAFALENPELYQLCFERPVPGFVPSEQSFETSLQLQRLFYDRTEQLRKELVTDLSTQQIVNMVITVMHGLTALHVANDPQLPVGQGRFGSLIPVAVSILEKAWPLKAENI